MNPEYKRLYGKQLTRMKEVLTETEDRGMAPLKVATTIERAIRRKNPKARYIVGTDARLMRRVAGLVGDKNFDKLMRRSMKLPDDAPKGR
jgi:hypothetical protein